ncbi:mechanosensitive ion channel family protein [Halomicrobium salinisoli]|uniref:mechanosensitive ion channel family protein n=1 Tax=Halomicrobium salinisoli TaxID=2878391 RepID=UPI001CF0633D|nr:mechanosensitive ion channel domain-containing protein [Halomicrobium salinisoli]
MTGAAIPLQSGVIAEFLAGAGVPFADDIGSAITFVVVFLAIYLLGKVAILPAIDRLLRSRNLDAHARKPLRRVASIVVLFVAVGIAFAFADYGNILTALATIGAAATLAVGFAMQDVLKNFVSGIFIYTDEPFRIGDWIEWGDHAGIVEDISLRVTRVRTFDNELLTVPNSQLTEDVIKNPVAKDKLRMKIDFGIGYDDDIQAATEIVVEEAEAHPEILEDPAPSVRLVELGDSSVGLQSRVWIANPSRSDFVKVKSDYVQAVKERFDDQDVDIPYPNRTIGGEIEFTNVDAMAEPTTNDD